MENDLKSTKCKRCGRTLKTPEAVELGMGKTCWKKFTEANLHKPLFNKPQREQA